MKYNYTIIIPHKNVPSLLKRCLDSIPEREDLQILIVDDSSSSAIVDFDNFPGKERRDVNIIYTKEGRGAGYARNVGLLQADSKWVLFADADDYYTDELNIFLNEYVLNEDEVVFFHNKCVDSNNISIEYNRDLMVHDLLEECNYNLDTLRYKAHAPWTKMVKLDFIRKHGITYQEVIAANDVWFNVLCGYYAKRISISNRIVYARTIREGSLFYSMKKENLLSRIKVGYKVNRFLREKNVDENYYVETWGYFLDLRKVSKITFISNIIPYVINTPKCMLIRNIKYLFSKKK